MTRVISITLADTNPHTLSSVLPAVPAGQIGLNKGNFVAFRASDANSGTQSISIGTANYATDGFLVVTKGDPTFVMQSSVNSISLTDFTVKASAASTILEIVICSI